MAKISRSQDLPDWFDLKKYLETANFGAAEWYTQLAYRKEMLLCNPWFPDVWGDDNSEEISYNAEIWRRRMATQAPPIRDRPILCTEWETDYLGTAQEQPVANLTMYDLKSITDQDQRKAKRSATPAILDYIAKPIAESLPESVKYRTLRLEKLYPVVTTKAAVLVDLSASDLALEASFRAWLKGARASQQSAASKRTNPLYARWAGYGVLPYLDLHMWAMETKNSIPRHIMADAVSSYSKGESTFSKTVVPLAAELMRDLSGLRALAAVEAAAQALADEETFKG